MHHPVALTEGIATAVQCQLGSVQYGLQGCVQIGSTDHTPLHRGKDLDVACRTFIGFGQAFFYQLDDGFSHLFRFFYLHKEEVGLLTVAGVGELSLVDGMGTHDDAAGLCLPEDTGQPDDRNLFGIDDVTKHVPGTHTGKLVDVAHQYKAHIRRQSFHQVVHQDDVYHGTLVHNERISFQRVFVIALVTIFRVVFQKPVDGLCFHTCRLAHSFGGTSCRCGKQDT